jgi:hypothetical protein
MSKPAPKRTPPAEGPAGTFDPIAVGDKIKEHLAEADYAQEESEAAWVTQYKADARARRHTRAAAKLLLDVKKHHAEHLDPICERIGLGQSRRYELLAIVEGRKTEEETKAGTNRRVQKHRKKKKEAATGKTGKKEDASPSIQPGQDSVSPPETESGEGEDLRGHNRPPADDDTGGTSSDPTLQMIEVATATLERGKIAKSEHVRTRTKALIESLHVGANDSGSAERPVVH